MHTAPVTLQVPDYDLETQQGAPTSADVDRVIPSSVLQDLQVRPAGPRVKTQQEKKQNKNWILSSSPATDEEDGETTRDRQDEEPAPSGWGWLADDVRARQQKQKDEEKKMNETEEKENEFEPPSVFPKEENEPRTSGLFVNTAFKPVSGSPPTKDKEKNADESTSSRDVNPDEQRSRTDGPAAAENTRTRTPADQTGEQKFGADATWGNEGLWNKNSKTVSTLPQTEALLSMPKLNTIKPAGLERAGLKPGVGGGERIEPARPESAPRNLAGSFQPLPTAPVNDLGSSPWDGGLPGKAPFGGSAPFSPAPSVTPSTSIGSLKTPDLPKPSSPWLR